MSFVPSSTIDHVCRGIRRKRNSQGSNRQPVRELVHLPSSPSGATTCRDRDTGRYNYNRQGFTGRNDDPCHGHGGAGSGRGGAWFALSSGKISLNTGSLFLVLGLYNPTLMVAFSSVVGGQQNVCADGSCGGSGGVSRCSGAGGYGGVSSSSSAGGSSDCVTGCSGAGGGCSKLPAAAATAAGCHQGG